MFLLTVTLYYYLLGHVDLVEAVCSHSAFENRSKLIDRNTQTPYHYAMRAKHTDKTVKVILLPTKNFKKYTYCTFTALYMYTTVYTRNK